MINRYAAGGKMIGRYAAVGVTCFAALALAVGAAMLRPHSRNVKVSNSGNDSVPQRKILIILDESASADTRSDGGIDNSNIGKMRAHAVLAMEPLAVAAVHSHIPVAVDAFDAGLHKLDERTYKSAPRLMTLLKTKYADVPLTAQGTNFDAVVDAVREEGTKAPGTELYVTVITDGGVDHPELLNAEFGKLAAQTELKQFIVGPVINSELVNGRTSDSFYGKFKDAATAVQSPSGPHFEVVTDCDALLHKCIEVGKEIKN